MPPSNVPEVLTHAESSICIRGGRIIDPASNRDEVGDLFIEQGRIVDRLSHDGSEVSTVLDATGKVVTPGFIDMHVHLREPGYEYQETIASGTRAAGAGGFTAVACMPNTNPVIDNAEVVRFVRDQARIAHSRVYPVGAITRGTRGEQLAEIGDMVEAGIVGISDGIRSVADTRLMRYALEYSKMFDIPVIVHCEDTQLTDGGMMNEGITSTMLGLKGMPGAGEDIVIARDIMLAELTGSRLHVAHISTARGVALIREAKQRGLSVTAETTPYHFTLTDETLSSYNTHMKVNPPLRTSEDLEAIQAGLQDGTIDAIASSHAPHAIDEKNVEYAAAPFGMIGLETSLGLIMTQLVQPGRLTLSDAIRTLTVAPSRIFGLDSGTLRVGSVADVTIFDPQAEWTVTSSSFFSKSCNSAFLERTLQGQVTHTIIGGQTRQWHGIQ